MSLNSLLIEDDAIFGKKLKIHLTKYEMLVEADQQVLQSSRALVRVLIDIITHGKLDDLELLKMTTERGLFSKFITHYDKQELRGMTLNIGSIS